MRRRSADSFSGTVADAMVTIPKTTPISSTVGEARSAFGDAHVHMLLLTNNGYLFGTVVRDDLSHTLPAVTPVLAVAQLADRTTMPDSYLSDVYRLMVERGHRRMAVVDGNSRLLGLLCLKRDLTGFCSDSGITARAHARQSYNEVSCALG